MTHFDPSTLPNGAFVSWHGREVQIYSHYPEDQRTEERDCIVEDEDGNPQDAVYADLLPLPARATPQPELLEVEEGAASVPVRTPEAATMKGGMKVITVVNNAGGVGKTSLVQNVGYEFAQAGLKVLLIDGDRQANLSSWNGVYDVQEEDTLHPIVASRKAPLPRPRHVHGMDLIPSFWDLGDTEKIAATLELRDALRDRLNELRGHWDIVLFDSPPAMGQLTTMAAIASDFLVVPLSTRLKGVEALEGVTKFLGDIRNYNPKLEVAMFVPTMYDGRRNSDKEAYQFMQEQIPAQMLATPVPERLKFWDAAAKEGKPVTLYAPHSPVAEDVRRLAGEIAAAVGINLGVRTGTDGEA